MVTSGDFNVKLLMVTSGDFNDLISLIALYITTLF